MQKYGIIYNKELILAGEAAKGARPVVYEDIPEFDQATQYVIQQAPADMGDHIFMGVEVLEMPEQEDAEEDC